MTARSNRLEDYQVTQLFPANIFDSSKNKTLPITLYFFKIGRFFSFEDIGNFKTLQKQYEKDLCSNLYYNKPYSCLNHDQQIDLKKLLNKRASTPTRQSPYVKFLVKSILKSTDIDVQMASYEEEINEGWCFSIDDVKYDVTLNKHKFFKENQILINADSVIDKKGMIKKDFTLKIASILPFELNIEKIQQINSIFNDQRDKMIFLYSYVEESEILDINLKSQRVIDLKK